MKIAFTTLGVTLAAPLDSRFGRASKFILYDLERDYFEVIDNRQNLNTDQGAGIQSAETVSRIAKSTFRPSSHGLKFSFLIRGAGGG